MDYDYLFVTEMFGFDEIPLEFDNGRPDDPEDGEAE